MNRIENYKLIHLSIQEAIDDFLIFKDKDSREEFETILHIVGQIANDSDRLTEQEQQWVTKITDLSLKINKYLSLKIYW